MMKHKLTAMLMALLLTLVVNAQRTYPVPEYMGFSMAEDAMTTDTMYLYNVGAQAYLSEGNAWGTQAMMGDDGILLYISKYVPEIDAAWDGKTYEINNYCSSKKSWMQMYIENEASVYVDHGRQGNNCWLFQIEENDDQTFRIYGADISKFSHENYPGTYLGVPEYIDSYFSWEDYPKGRSCLKNNVFPLLNPEKMDPEKCVAYHIDWAFVTKAEFERQKEKVEIYNQSVELIRQLWAANMSGIDTTKEQEVYDNPESTLAEIIDAINSVKNKVPNQIAAQWKYPEPATTGFSIAENAFSTDTMYLYNVGAQAYLTEGNAWGTQASMGDTGLKVFVNKYINENLTGEDSVWDGRTYLIYDFSLYKNQWKNLFIDSETEMYVDHGSQGVYCWHFQIKDNGNGTFKIYAADDSKYSHANYPGTYIGVVEYADGTVANTVSPLLNPVEMDKAEYAAFHTDWAFVAQADYESHQRTLMTYRSSQELLAALEKAKALGLDTAAEQAVYDNTESGAEQLQDAVISLKEKTAQYYETTVTLSSPMSMDEEYVINTTFETDDLWMTTTGVQVSGTASNKTEEQGRDGEYHFTGTFWENWSFTAFKGKMYRVMEYMPKGVYRLELSAFANGYYANDRSGSYVYMNYDSVEVTYACPERYEVMSVNDYGTVEIGLKETVNKSSWMGIDNCHLTYYGNNREAYAYLMNEVVAGFSTDAQFNSQLRTEYEAMIKDYAHPETLEEAKMYEQAIKAKQKEITDCINAYEELQRCVDDIKQALEKGYEIEDFGESAVALALEADEKMKEGRYTAAEAISTLREINQLMRKYKTDISTPINCDSSIPTDLILLSGQRVNANSPLKGIHIIRYSDGTVKKVYVR